MFPYDFNLLSDDFPTLSCLRSFAAFPTPFSLVPCHLQPQIICTSFSLFPPSFLNPLPAQGTEGHVGTLAGGATGRQWGVAGSIRDPNPSRCCQPHSVPGHRPKGGESPRKPWSFSVFLWELGKCRINNKNSYSSWKILFLLVCFLPERESWLELHKVWVIEENSFSTGK